MANHKSSKKRILRNNKRNEINSNRISRIRTYVKKVETEISSENKDKANEAFKLAMPEIQSHRESPPCPKAWRLVQTRRVLVRPPLL